MCAAQAVWSVMLAQASGAMHAPGGHVAPGAQAVIAAHEHPFGSAPHSAAVVWAEQLVMSVAAICSCCVGGAWVSDVSQPPSPAAAATDATKKT